MLLLGLMMTLPARAAVVIAPRDDSGRMAEAVQAARDTALGHYGMTPIRGGDVADGVYDVAVESTSPFFKIVKAVLTVEKGQMSADITIGSESYDLVRMEDEIAGETRDGSTVFHIPVPALNMPFDCAAHSVKRDQWYDRQLLIDAADLPPEALAFPLPDYAMLEKALLSREGAPAPEPEAAAIEPMALEMPDGEYAIEVNLSGGSGRASVSSPTLLIVREGRAWARLLWSSSHYDYMLLGDQRYEDMDAEDGISTFEIPVPVMDAPFPVVADTTAMGDPVEIDYQLTFYSESIGDRSQVPQEAAKQVLAISLVIIVAGGVLNHFVKKRRK